MHKGILVFLLLIPNVLIPYKGQTYKEYVESVRMEQFIYHKNPKAKMHKKDVHLLIYHVNTQSKKYNLNKYIMFSQALWEGQWLKKPNSKTIGAAGEKSYFQIMKKTAKGLGFSYKDLDCIGKATSCRNKFYKSLLKKYKGDEYKVLAFYNGGGNWHKIPQAKRYPFIIIGIEKELRNFIKI